VACTASTAPDKRRSDVAVSVDYVVRETASNLWRNRLMTIAAVLTVAVSLSLVGAALLLRQGSANATGTLERGTQVTVWMEPDANAQEVSAVGTQLSQLNYVQQPCAYWNKARNFSEARRLLPSDVFQATTEAEMPTSYWCTPIALSDAAQVVRTFSGTAGVLSVTEPQQTIHNEETVINVSKWVCLAVAIVLIVSAAVLILNTIRMAIFARRREVSVMKLVGATNWFIRVPFMSEGLLQGLFGSLLAAVVVYFVYLFINHEGSGRTTSNIFTAMHMSGSEVLLTNVVVVLVGMAIGSIGSAIAIRRFLDV
jgi:cell division transport system permease protein